MGENSTSASSGISIIGLLGVVFIVLKLTGNIDWSWWWVLAPFWGGACITLLLAFVIIAIVVFMD